MLSLVFTFEKDLILFTLAASEESRARADGQDEANIRPKSRRFAISKKLLFGDYIKFLFCVSLSQSLKSFFYN
jgi:hypothetical protein